MATSEELVTAVLERLEEVGTGQPIANEDTQKVSKALPRLFRFLLDTNAVLQPIEPSDIDDAQFFPLRSFIAWKLAGDFGLAANAALVAEGAQAVEDLKTLARINRGTRDRLRVDPALMIRRRRGYFRISN
ncbi:hypothetical protein [Bosea sp. (in: a-proteobacteria)]|uniref:hypothetical protein n=1 Tax=Bosea sp. (in: a-proteobacteria) TaxID=1871050 RepID=UPI00262129D1|nr:hypothetical protein [Bosea sp. (in: a-proteobacteria)]MCO5092658.1 hypothetical protein [Bosea sp. (in: a-proteobacteria)]